MVTKTLSIFVLIFSFANVSLQSQQISKELLIGTWASCLDDSLYVELQLTNGGNYVYHWMVNY